MRGASGTRSFHQPPGVGRRGGGFVGGGSQTQGVRGQRGEWNRSGSLPPEHPHYDYHHLQQRADRDCPYRDRYRQTSPDILYTATTVEELYRVPRRHQQLAGPQIPRNIQTRSEPDFGDWFLVGSGWKMSEAEGGGGGEGPSGSPYDPRRTPPTPVVLEDDDETYQQFQSNKSPPPPESEERLQKNLQSRRRRTASGTSEDDVYNPLHDLVIPLPDSSEYSQARFASMENLRDSPIALPDPSCCWSPRSEDAQSSVSSQADSISAEFGFDRDSTPVAGAEAFIPFTKDMSREKEFTPIRSEGYRLYQDSKEKGLYTAEEKATPDPPPPRVPYTPGSYLENKRKQMVANRLAEVGAQSSQHEGSSYSSRSESMAENRARENQQFDSFSDYSARESANRMSSPKESPSRLGSVRSTMVDSPLQDVRHHHGKHRQGYDMTRDSFTREDLARDGLPRDKVDRESLVREVLARESREREEKQASSLRASQSSLAESTTEGYAKEGPALGPGYTARGRDNLHDRVNQSRKSAPDTGYTVRDYQDYLNKNYGERYASSERDAMGRVSPPRSTREFSPCGSHTSYSSDREHGAYQPYRKAESVSSERSYEPTGLRSESVLSDNYGSERSYASTAPRSSGYRSGSVASDCSTEYEYGPVPPTREDDSRQGSTSSGRPRQPPHQPRRPQPSSWTGRGTGLFDKIDEEREYESRGSRRSFFDRPSLLESGPVRRLLEDLLCDREWDRGSLFARHGRLLRDDSFCRDFFSRDWDSIFKEDDEFFDDVFQRKKSKKVFTETQEEVHDQGVGKGQKSYRMKRTESSEDDDVLHGGSGRGRGRENTTPTQASGASSGPAHRGPTERGHSGTGPTGRGASEGPAHQGPTDRGPSDRGSADRGSADADRGRDRPGQQGQAGDGGSMQGDTDSKQSNGNVFDKARFKFGSFGSFDAEDGSGSSEQHAERQRGKKPTDQGDYKEKVWDKDTFFFKDFDDLIHRFKDIKWKAAFDSYDQSDKEKKDKEKDS